MKNAYERRREHRKLLQHARTEQSRFVKILEIEAAIKAYEGAYRDYYKTNCNVKYLNGWYWVGNKRVRRSDLEMMTNMLLVNQHERELQEYYSEPAS